MPPVGRLVGGGQLSTIGAAGGAVVESQVLLQVSALEDGLLDPYPAQLVVIVIKGGQVDGQLVGRGEAVAQFISLQYFRVEIFVGLQGYLQGQAHGQRGRRLYETDQSAAVFHSGRSPDGAGHGSPDPVLISGGKEQPGAGLKLIAGIVVMFQF